MLIVRISPYSGKKNEREIDITMNQYTAWMEGLSIQKAMPELSDEDREFILTGLLEEEWDVIMSEEDDEEIDLSSPMTDEDADRLFRDYDDRGISGFDDPNFFVDDTI
jgi:hypothetical protein